MCVPGRPGAHISQRQGAARVGAGSPDAGGPAILHEVGDGCVAPRPRQTSLMGMLMRRSQEGHDAHQTTSADGKLSTALACCAKLHTLGNMLIAELCCADAMIVVDQRQGVVDVTPNVLTVNCGTGGVMWLMGGRRNRTRTEPTSNDATPVHGRTDMMLGAGVQLEGSPVDAPKAGSLSCDGLTRGGPGGEASTPTAATPGGSSLGPSAERSRPPGLRLGTISGRDSHSDDGSCDDEDGDEVRGAGTIAAADPDSSTVVILWFHQCSCGPQSRSACCTCLLACMCLVPLPLHSLFCDRMVTCVCWTWLRPGPHPLLRLMPRRWSQMYCSTPPSGDCALLLNSA
jgi:hypothetical protein